MTDRLAEIKHHFSAGMVSLKEVDWLIQEVERLRGRVAALRTAHGWIEGECASLANKETRQ